MKDEGDFGKQPAGTVPLDRRLNQTLKGMQNLLSRGRTLPGKILLSRKTEPAQSASKPVPEGEEIDDDYIDVGKGGDPLEDRSSSQASTSGHHSGDENEGSLREEHGASGGGEGRLGGSQHGTPRTNGGRATDSARVDRFKKVLAASTVDLDALRELAWSGVPPDMRPQCWRLLLGYAPPNSDRRQAVLARKRQEYRDCVPQYYDIPNTERSEDEVNTLRQIAVDVPRTVPDVKFYQQPAIQTSLTRILYIWAIRHPASGYVQGINDLVTPFLAVFLSEILEGDMEQWASDSLSPETLYIVEADCYWCLCKLLDGIQDHYTFAQPGIQRLVFKLKELVRRIDEPVAKRIEEQGLEFLQFAFRWFNCLLIRELPFHLVCRLWDTYLAEGDGFADFLVYVCASFLLTWSEDLQKLEFQDMVLFLQHLPTKKWTHQELEIVLSRAYMWREMFGRSPNHLNSS